MTSTRAVPILMYHSIDGTGSVISMHPSLFRHQMERLSSRGYHTATVSELLDAWDAGAPLPTRTVAITFDDAMVNVLTEALPVMATLGFRATVFAVSGMLGRQNEWPEQVSSIPRLPLLSRDGLLELVASGFEIGAHSVHHRKLTRLTASEQVAEVVDCKRQLEDQLGVVVNTFAYPFGDENAVVRAVAAGHYRASFGTSLAFATARDDRHALPRVDMYYYRNPTAFGQFDTMVGQWYLRARAVARRVRARVGA